MKWFSEGRKQHVEVGEMNAHHARAALAKLERGDYFDEDGNPPSVQDTITLRSELSRRIRDTEVPETDSE